MASTAPNRPKNVDGEHRTCALREVVDGHHTRGSGHSLRTIASCFLVVSTCANSGERSNRWFSVDPAVGEVGEMRRGGPAVDRVRLSTHDVTTVGGEDAQKVISCTPPRSGE